MKLPAESIPTIADDQQYLFDIVKETWYSSGELESINHATRTRHATPEAFGKIGPDAPCSKEPAPGGAPDNLINGLLQAGKNQNYGPRKIPEIQGP